MLQITNAKPAGTKGSYYFNYYSREAEGHSHWFGEGAELFKLRGSITQKPFQHLLNGLSPDGRMGFFKNSGDPKRNAFWDLTFNVPKSLSILWTAASDERRKQIEAVIEKALHNTLECVEQRYGLSRSGAGGRDWVPAKLTFALFRHINSRENQPHLHWHALLFNEGIRQDGTVGTLQTKPLFEAKMELGLHFCHELARMLKNDLGLKLEHEKSGFHIVGVPKEICEHNSKRRHQIVEYMKANGISGAKAAKVAAVKTRQPKTYTPQEVLLAAWQKDAAGKDFTEAHVERLFGKAFPKEKAGSIPHQTIHEPKADAELAARETHHQDRKDDLGHQQKNSNASESKDQRLGTKPPPKQEEKEYQRGSAKDKTASSEKSKTQESAKDSQRHDQRERPGPQSSKHKEKSKQRESSGHQIKSDPVAFQAFQRELRKATDRIFPENQTRKKVEKMAFAIGRKYDIRATDILAAIDDLKLPIHTRFFRVEWNLIAPEAPFWNPMHNLRAPVIKLTNKPRKWGKIYYAKPIPGIGGPKMEFRVQDRKLFPAAPGWNPLSKLSVKALRFGPYREYADTKKAEKAKASSRPELKEQAKKYRTHHP